MDTWSRRFSPRGVKNTLRLAARYVRLCLSKIGIALLPPFKRRVSTREVEHYGDEKLGDNDCPSMIEAMFPRSWDFTPRDGIPPFGPLG